MSNWAKLTHPGGKTVPDPHVGPRKLDPPAINKVHAWIEKWRSAPPAERKTMGGISPVVVIAMLLEVSQGTVRRWLADGERDRTLGNRPNGTLVHDLADLADEIRQLQVREIAGTLYGIATDSEHPKVVNAATLLLPRLDPAGWGPQAQALDVRVESSAAEVYQIPQAVFDALTDDARAELLECQERIARDTARIDALLTAAARG